MPSDTSFESLLRKEYKIQNFLTVEGAIFLTRGKCEFFLLIIRELLKIKFFDL
jgi:hypothetical protein